MKRHYSILFLILSSLLFFLAACDPQGGGEIVETQPVYSVGPDLFEIYFSVPDGPQADTQRNGPDSYLADTIKEARMSVEVAMYDLNLWSIRNALIAAHENGVLVRVVCEANYLDRPEFQQLIDAGITVLPDLNDNLMHNKFVIIDRYEVWTGSMNMTLNGAYHNDNNLLRIQSSRIAESYLEEFEEMYTSRLFGTASPQSENFHATSVNGIDIELYFSPEDNTADRIVELLENAEESIRFMAFSFTSDDLAHAMLYAADKGVSVAGVMDAGQYSSNIGTEYDRFVDAGLNVYLDSNQDRMHHKVIIIDSRIVITGSYNFSSSAENRNDENTVIVFDPWLAEQYLLEFERVYQQAQD